MLGYKLSFRKFEKDSPDLYSGQRYLIAVDCHYWTVDDTRARGAYLQTQDIRDIVFLAHYCSAEKSKYGVPYFATEESGKKIGVEYVHGFIPIQYERELLDGEGDLALAW